MSEAKTIVLFPEGAFGPTNNCVGIANVLREREPRVAFVVEVSVQVKGGIWSIEHPHKRQESR